MEQISFCFMSKLQVLVCESCPGNDELYQGLLDGTREYAGVSVEYVYCRGTCPSGDSYGSSVEFTDGTQKIIC